jgi:hypothetical protein
MKKEWLVKTLAFGIVVLFIGVSFQPIIAEKTISVEKESNYNNVDFEQAKAYLFQTLIDISNNPEVKQFMDEHKHILIPRNNNNYDCKNTIQKIYMQNPRLLKSIIFTRPKMTYEYLETNYNKSLEIVDILGEEESSNIVESVKIVNLDLFNELKNIIANDEDLSNRVSVLEEMNNNVKSNMDFSDFPVICGILFILALITIPILFSNEIFHRLNEWAILYSHPLLAKFFKFFDDVTFNILYPLWSLLLDLGCLYLIPY